MINIFLWGKNLSLRSRIFLALIFITLISSILIALVSILHFQYESQEYHKERLLRKEEQIKQHIEYVLETTPHPLITANLASIFKEKIFEIADIHNLEIDIYDLQGRMLINSRAPVIKGQITINISDNLLEKIKYADKNRFIGEGEARGDVYNFSYSYLMDHIEKKPISIIRLPYKQDDSYYKQEIENFLAIFGSVYLGMFSLAIWLAFYLSRYITKSLETISRRLTETSLTEKNKKIDLVTHSSEIDKLIQSYNKMIDELEESANKLAQSEREGAWREMAKQVAHEIKNPLTPMRLTVQSFEMRFNPQDPNIRQKVVDFSKTLIQQIDTMSAVASAFSNFASMPAQQNETLNVVDVVSMALDIFNENYIEYYSSTDEIITKIDRTQLIRIITNLVKNAIQAIPEEQINKKVLVSVKKEENNTIISVCDNGKGIAIQDFERIFEPKFTTKTSGMGLGLAIIKNIIENYQGKITFESKLTKGTTFKVILPIINK
ncbi:sensor histidine kinase [Flavobacterium columnare]|uniref:sensor histidine kinase n=1 Tax=Flavobacterium columnare TaxID=996 RepID=UPI0013FDBF9F|nr:ATP-binding protein [Flavobacterium columnare]